MVVREVLAAVGRRWYVLGVVLLIAATATVAFARDGGMFTTRTVVTFMIPAETSFSPENGIDDVSVIAFAGVVAQTVNNGRPPAQYSMSEAPFFGAGVREGVLVTLSDAGNQWVSSYHRAEVAVQIVGRTEEWVQQTQSEIIEKIYLASEQQQAPVNDPANRIVASVVPLTKQIYHVTANRTAQVMAGSAMLAAGLIVGVWLCAIIDVAQKNKQKQSPGGVSRSIALDRVGELRT